MSSELERLQTKAKIEKAKAKAFGMRLTEAGFTVGGAALGQVLESKTGRTTLADTGMLARVSWDGLMAVLGIVGIMTGKGFVQDAASGLFNAGIVPITRRAVAKAMTP